MQRNFFKKIYEIIVVSPIFLLLLAVLIALFSGSTFFINDKEEFKNFLTMLSLILAYYCLIQTFDSTKANRLSLQPYLTVYLQRKKKKSYLILENLGPGHLYNLKIDDTSKNILLCTNIIKIHLNEFDQNICNNSIRKFEINLKKAAKYKVNFPKSIIFYYEDGLDNHYKQVINIALDGDNVVFMSSKPETCKKRNRRV